MAFLRYGFAVPAMVVLMSGSAHAALTADQVWQSWKDGAGLVGLTITVATEANSGGTLTLNGLSIAPEGAPDPLTVSALTLTENGDGTVTITPGDAIGLQTGSAEDGGSAKLTHDGLSIIAREGDNGGIVYDYSANKLDIAYDFTTPGYAANEGETPAPGKDNGSFSFEGLKGSYSDTPGTNRVFAVALEAAKLVYAINSDQPSFETKSTSNSESVNLVLNSEFTLPSTITLGEIQSAADFGTALQQGLQLKLNTTNGESTGKSSEKSMFFSLDMDMKAGPAVADLLFNKDVFSLTSKGEGGLEINVTSEGLPAPAKITMADVEMNLLSPVMSGDTAADYGAKLILGQLTLNDESWALFDPQGALKREPFDLALDLNGKAKVDWIAMAVADEAGGQPVIPQPESLNITQAALKLAGAALDATGALTFDNSLGFPAPLGEVNVNVSGAEQLITGLIATGIISEEDAMGVRMMMGAFMVPGSEPDSLTSKVEFKEGFSIFANGQQLQ
ncbi:DUF2125 domain-containing protein [Pseudogemmobacter bohemicus]|uniref:DUF2125 domain-containing protein n=1 Tax=Pseudogemmobacter bohemicus TaxID=2250708 RepID=UPI000DD489DC|nr:DUF2125 domain-containing protein [Pseudogemmobacter bohemicus]